MNEVILKIYRACLDILKPQNFEYKFFVVNGSEENKQIKIANSIEYEFVNSGSSKVILNDNLIIYPYWMGIEPVRLKFTCQKNEVDVSIYEYRFEDAKAGEGVWGYVYTAVTSSNGWLPYDPTGAAPLVNKLQVVVKQRSSQYE